MSTAHQATSSSGFHDNHTSNIDLANIHLLIERLDASISECQAQVQSALDSTSPDYDRYNQTIDVLCTDVTSIRDDIKSLQTQIQRPQPGLEKLNSLGVDISTAKKNLEALQHVCVTLDSILLIKAHLTEFDTSIRGRHFDIAADALSQATALLMSIDQHMTNSYCALTSQSNAENASQRGFEALEGDDVLHCVAHDQIVTRRVELKRILRQIVESLFYFTPHGVEVITDPKSLNQQSVHEIRPDHNINGDLQSSSTSIISMNGITLEQLWHALKGTGCLKSEIYAMGTSLQHSIIAPAIEASRKVPIGKTLIANTLTPGSTLSSSLMWTWFEANEESNDEQQPSSSSLSTGLEQKNQEESPTSQLTKIGRSTILLLQILESLFEFIASHFFPGHPEAVELLGSLLYSDVSETLIRQLGNDTVEEIVLTRLKVFETKLRALHVIPFETSTLTSFVNKHEQLLFESKQTKMLSEVRRLCLSTDPAVVLVGDKSTDDTVLKCLDEILEMNPSVTMEELHNYLHRDYRRSPLLLPKCYVSRAAYETVAMVDELLKDVFDKIKEQNVDNGLFDSTVESIQKAIQLFALLRSSTHRNRLQKDPMFGAVFFSDCLYISRRMLLLLANVGRDIPPCVQPIQSRLTLVHVISRLRSVEEQVFGSMLAYQRQEILTLCQNFGDLTRVSLDRHYADVEGHIGEVVQFLKGLTTCWTDALPRSISTKCLARLLDTFIDELLNEICSQIPNSSASFDDKHALAHLLSSTRDQLRPIVEITSSSTNHDTSTHNSSSEETIAHHSSLWRTFCLFRDLLEADVLQFAAKKHDIRECLTVPQIQTILIINERKTQSDNEILELLAS